MLSTNATDWMTSGMEWAASYFGANGFDLFRELAVVLDRLDDWEWVNRNSRSDVAGRMGFHGGAIHSRTDLAMEPSPV